MSYLIFVYEDYGSGPTSVRLLKDSLQSLFPSSTVQTVSGPDIQQGVLLKTSYLNSDIKSRLLCIGGGFDLGYVESVGDKGCAEIRRFVSAGGNYLGICAGAYFACSHVEFDRHGPLEVTGTRNLRFLSGRAIGPCNSKYHHF